MKKHFLLAVLMTEAWLLGTAAAQVDLKSLKAMAEVASKEAPLTREIVLGDLPLKSRAEMAISGRFSSLRTQNGLNDSEYAAAKLEAAKMRNGASRTNLVPPAIVKHPDTPTPSGIFVGVDESCSGITPSEYGTGSWTNLRIAGGQ